MRKAGPRFGLVVLGAVLGLAAMAAGQAADNALPDAPGVAKESIQGTMATPAAGRYDKYIPAGDRAVPFVFEDKLKFGLHDAISIGSLEVWLLAASWEQAINTSPNYGEMWDGYGKRIGAAALRDTSETLLVDTVFAPLFHEDPRYYKVGRRKGVVYRTAYAITRPLITRTDGGGSAPNAALLAGDLGGTILTNAYYPSRNRGFGQTAKGFGTSLGAIALGNAFHEFKDDFLGGLRK